MAWGPGGEYLFEYVGGRLCLDFTNTVGGMRPDAAVEHLIGYQDLVTWALGAGAIGEAQARCLRASAERAPAAAERAVRRARELREAIFRGLLAASHGESPSDADLAILNRALGRALARRRLVRRDGGWTLAWPEDADALDAPVWPVAVSAAELLASPGDLSRLHECGESEAGTCDWLFVDETRSGTRRWCTMKDCGNRAKQRRHYHRVRRARQGA
jgi:predicted RNA-binding Zn ribbon-like protein